MPLLALVFTMGLAPCSSSAILTLSFSISSSLRTRLRLRTSTTRACSWSFSANSVESRSSAIPISRRSCLRLRVSLTRSASRLFRCPVLKSLPIPHGVGKRFDICKYNTFSINGLKVICEPSSEGGAALLGGPDAKFLKASARLTKGGRRLIFSNPKRDFAEMGTAFEKVIVR